MGQLKNYSKNGRPEGKNLCSCGRPLSGTRIRKGKTQCVDCEKTSRVSSFGSRRY
jgi:hypothetical protein